MKKIISLLICSLAVTLFACDDKIVVNNAIVYLVDDSCIDCGTIDGEKWQSVFVGEYSTLVVAVPKEGYRFLSWSDGNVNPSRSDLATNDNSDGPLIFYAFFGVDNA